MRKFSVLILFYLITFSVSAQLLTELDALEIEARTNPSFILEQLKSDEYIELKPLEKQYLYLTAKHQIAEYLLVDSTISRLVTYNIFKTDSMLLMRYLSLWSELQKITDQFEKAIETNRIISAYFLRKNNLLGYSKANAELAEIYRTTENFDLGLGLLNLTHQAIESINSPEAESVKGLIYSRKAAIYAEKRVFPDSVKKYAEMALGIGKMLKDLNLIASSYNELGYLYINTNPNDPAPIAKEYFMKAITIWDSIDFKINSLYARLNLSRYYNRKSQYQEGIDILEKYFEKVSELNLAWEKGAYYEMLSRLYAGLGKFKEAFSYSDLAKENLIESQRAKYNQQLALSNMQFELRRKELELSKKQIEIDKFQFESNSKKSENTFLYALLIGCLLIGGILILFWYNSNRQKNRLKKQQSEIIEINHELTDAVGEKETLLKEVNHRVKNNLSVLSSLLYLQQRKINNPEVKSAIKDSLLRINTMSLIHESLYQQNDMSHVDFQEYLKKLIDYNKNIYWGNRPLEVLIECETFTPDLSTSVPLAMIVNELVTNSFKYAFDTISEPKITIKYVNNVLIFSDNGPGKTDEQDSESLGLKLISIFSKQIKAKIENVKDEFGFHFEISLNK